ncbi:TPA: pilus assembly protein PilC [Candidatus Sumerlaeota bacterium]|jgi:type IV pilus assembly protein PilC|nr:pilus assembly protein PilC [Candidatus Sumerlaeota bacterium]
MALFQYTARNNQGKVVTGTIEAGNQSVVIKQLREQGLLPTGIQEGATLGANTALAKTKPGGRSGKIRLDDLVVFSRQFATMIRAGLPLIEVLNILSEQAEKATMRQVLKTIEKDVEAGSSLTEAMVKHPKVFNTFFVSMVKAGEAAGMLASILDQIATYMEKVASLQRKIKSAVMYPSVVATVAMLITVFLLTSVVPVFVDIFSAIEGELPMPTRIVLFASDTLRNYYPYVLAVLIGVAIFIFQATKTKNGRYFLDRMKLRLPIFGPLFLKVAISKFSRTLSTLIRSGVSILAALDIVASTSGNCVVEEAVIKTRIAIQNGESIAKPLTESNIFPPMVTRMVDVGERVGSLESMLSKIADFYEDQVDATVSGLTSLIEPLLIVFLGVVVGFIVIAMFMPLFKMIEYIK